MDFLSEKAVIFEEVHPLREYRKQNLGLNKIGENNGKRPVWRTHGSGSGSAGKVNTSSTDGSTRTLPECLNSHSNKRHFVKDCPVNPKELAKKLLEDRRKNNKAKPATVSAVVRKGSNSNTAASNLSAQVAPVSTNTSAALDRKIGAHTYLCRIDSVPYIVAISEPIIMFLSNQCIYLPTIWRKSAEMIQAFDRRSVQSQGRSKSTRSSRRLLVHAAFAISRPRSCRTRAASSSQVRRTPGKSSLEIYFSSAPDWISRISSRKISIAWLQLTTERPP